MGRQTFVAPAWRVTFVVRAWRVISVMRAWRVISASRVHLRTCGQLSAQPLMTTSQLRYPVVAAEQSAQQIYRHRRRLVRLVATHAVDAGQVAAGGHWQSACSPVLRRRQLLAWVASHSCLHSFLPLSSPAWRCHYKERRWWTHREHQERLPAWPQTCHPIARAACFDATVAEQLPQEVKMQRGEEDLAQHLVVPFASVPGGVI